MECINDLNGHVVTFYRVLQNDFAILRKLILETPSSRAIHREAEYVLKNDQYFSDIRVAWAFWVQANMSFSSKIFAGYGYGREDGCVKKVYNKKLSFIKSLKSRLDFTDIECNDSIKVIKSRDSIDTFTYADPPYYNADMGHYDGYSLQDFTDLLETLSNVKGKFLLSSYPSEVLSDFTAQNKWQKQDIIKPIVACKGDRSKMKVEVLTANYSI